jgi:hypothetical protein
MLAAAIMTGNARAEGPIGESAPFVGGRTRAEVQAELMTDRHLVTSYASEWTLQQNGQQPGSGYTRAQARADYIAAREQVHAMNSEHGGSGQVAPVAMRTPGNLFARSAR